MLFPFLKHFWRNVGYLFGSLLIACLILCIGAAAIVAALKFIIWLIIL